MLGNRQTRMLQLLDKQVSSCHKCAINMNGKCLPSWNKNSRYAIISESPNYNDVRNKRFFSGKAGSILSQELGRAGFNSSDFLLINSIQCRASGLNKGKPSIGELDHCKDFVRKYLKIIQPEKILCLGNYSKYIFTNSTVGVMRYRGGFKKYSLDGDVEDYPVLFTVNPGFCIYNPEQGMPILQEDLKLFKETRFQRKSNWLLSEDDFLL